MPLGAFKAALMGTAGVSTANVVLLHDTDYSNASTASITSGIDSTYGVYIFKFYNINPATNSVDFTFQFNAAGASGYNETLTTTFFRSYHQENDGGAAGMGFQSGQSQGTAFNGGIGYQIGNEADESAVAELHLFNPASTTYAKQWYVRSHSHAVGANDLSYETWYGGYINTTTAIDDIQFKMSSGNFDGTIKMWGVK